MCDLCWANGEMSKISVCVCLQLYEKLDMKEESQRKTTAQIEVDGHKTWQLIQICCFFSAWVWQYCKKPQNIIRSISFQLLNQKCIESFSFGQSVSHIFKVEIFKSKSISALGLTRLVLFFFQHILCVWLLCT